MKMLNTQIGTVIKENEIDIFLEINERFWDGTLQLDKFSHIIVLWWISQRDTPSDRSHMQDYPPYPGAELSGVFASRSPARPTPIGHSIVKVESINANDNRIQIDQIDAFDGTPIIDIKPYMPTSDRVDDAVMPSWFKDNISRYTS
ncbi:MAG: tRNA (N6-threonylcarbamoyladenosine(37)-N6)-methyltransferase TrmO [Candidatus Thorarchaeota archaeon]|jgi:tRNA-Thr(GGU) m(6)t(6)A37 methyltransferase TsaA